MSQGSDSEYSFDDDAPGLLVAGEPLVEGAGWADEVFGMAPPGLGDLSPGLPMPSGDVERVGVPPQPAPLPPRPPRRVGGPEGVIELDEMGFRPIARLPRGPVVDLSGEGPPVLEVDSPPRPPPPRRPWIGAPVPVLVEASPPRPRQGPAPLVNLATPPRPRPMRRRAVLSEDEEEAAAPPPGPPRLVMRQVARGPDPPAGLSLIERLAAMRGRVAPPRLPQRPPLSRDEQDLSPASPH